MQDSTLLVCGTGGGGQELTYGANLDDGVSLRFLDESGLPIDTESLPVITLEPGESVGFVVTLSAEDFGYTGRIVGDAHNGLGQSWTVAFSDLLVLPGSGDELLVAHPATELGEFSCEDPRFHIEIGTCVLQRSPTLERLDEALAGEPGDEDGEASVVVLD